MKQGPRPPGFVPGYMSEDLELRAVDNVPRYARFTEKPVQHVAVETFAGERIGYVYVNDEDDVARWLPVAGASPAALNLATPWVVMLHRAKERGLKPSAALDEMLRADLTGSRVVPGSLATAASLGALREIAGYR